MTICRKILTVAVFSMCLTIASQAQTASEILRSAEKALGGAKALKSIRSVRKTGRITRVFDGVTGKYVSQTSVPNQFHRIFDLGGSEFEVGFNGLSGWVRNSLDGLQTLTGAASINFQAAASFRNNLWLTLKNEKVRPVAGPQTYLDGRRVNVVVIITPKGSTVRMFFDATTGLLVRDEISSGDFSESCDYADYRDIGGTNQAYFNRINLGDQIFTVEFDEIKINQNIAKTEFDFPVISGADLPDIAALLTDLQANEDKVDEILDTYSYMQKSIFREVGKDGVLRESSSTTRQLSFYKGFRVARTVEKNGKPLDKKEQEDADRDAERQVEEIEKKIAKMNGSIAKPGSNTGTSDTSKRISIAEVLRASKLSNPRREHFRGRDVIVFDFAPNPGFDMKNAKSMIKILGKSAGVIWIDEKDRQVARLEAVLFENIGMLGGVIARMNKGATFALEKERVGGEIWLPSQADYNISVRVLLIKGIVINQIVKSYDYRKFETNVKEATVDETRIP